jgi:hypothetical protein
MKQQFKKETKTESDKATMHNFYSTIPSCTEMHLNSGFDGKPICRPERMIKS